MKLFASILNVSLFGAAVKTARACTQFNDCECTEFGTRLNYCAEINSTPIQFSTTDTSCSIGIGFCYCDNNNPNTDPTIGGGTCTYTRRAPSAKPSIPPTISSQPSDSTKPSISSQPSDSAKPSISSQPSDSTKPSISSQPSESSQPSDSAKPSISGWPSGSLSPTVSSAPSESSKPSDSAKPSISSQPSDSAKPSISSQPSESLSPMVSPSSAPSESSQPSVSVKPSISGRPSVSLSPTVSSAPSVSSQPSVSAKPSISAQPSAPLPKVGPSIVFYDPNKDGFQNVNDPNEKGLKDQRVELHCMRGGDLKKEAQMITGDDGKYEFTNIIPGICRIRVVPSENNYQFSAMVDGGNQIGEDGWSNELNLTYRDVADVPAGMYLPTPSANCDEKKCTNKEIGPLGYHDCGWGVFNDCTCQCVCDPGVCLSANSKCYDGCMTHLDFNTYGGCHPGVDCPWHRSKTGEPHCESSANFAGIHGVRETAELCCKQHFSSVNLNTCVADSKADVAAEEAKVAQDLARKKYFYPDMYGKQNCVFDSDYYDWMMGANKDHYLYITPDGCCATWYPGKEDCPNFDSKITPKQLDYKPYASEGFFYPHLNGSNCRFGRNYPMWMKLSPKHYLYTTPDECCSKWYPNESNCPLREDDGVQEGYFWVVDEAFYPNWKGNGCGHGNDYPEWMADVTQRDVHLFKTAEDCCKLWFPSKLTECVDNIVQSNMGEQVGGPANYNGGTWYPSMNGKYLCLDGNPPEWMNQEGYKDEYVFDSHAECCKAHYCEDIRGVVW
eukprot:CAMPEP_0181100192 /NCGR_PEP_ID=MMETSP1071-20121207/13063_1 /TAXON_ID=35127 /ORGANISM="Thalassiosira sp., Strain NH16" /LENGTH=780 /DNA_ID=CAMNT_0023182907 /DNA_START=66 /DNA_END=2405 /DNA_ORIENTATION=+